ncbi:MAG: His/Gly/Thr/Pro-type tRNA ligase C-terminal domain-containing protein, partial [Nanoarchaeota archaeon]
DQDKQSIELAGKIRASGVSCQLFYGKVGKALEYANSYQIPFVVFVGEQEVKKKKFKLKNMKSGKENLLTEKSLLEFLKKGK